MPPELDEALALITYVVATTWDEDLIWYCDRYGLEIEEEMVSEDLAVCAWLFDASILHHIRNETQLDYSRTYSEYQGRDKDLNRTTPIRTGSQRPRKSWPVGLCGTVRAISPKSLSTKGMALHGF